jgi:hypothetical protein
MREFRQMRLLEYPRVSSRVGLVVESYIQLSHTDNPNRDFLLDFKFSILITLTLDILNSKHKRTSLVFLWCNFCGVLFSVK